MTWTAGVSGNPKGRGKSHTKKGKERYTSRLPHEPCLVCGTVIRKHPRCGCGCDVLIGRNHYQGSPCNGGFDLHPDAVFWVLAAMVENVKTELKSKREGNRRRALAYVQSEDFGQWAGLIGVSASDAREALVGTVA